LSNEERGVVTGRIWLAGRKEPLMLRLHGDCLRDLAGCTVRFTNPRPEPDAALSVLAPEQNGVTGELTASRKTRQPAVSDQEMLELLEKAQPIPCRLANGLYLEWYSEANGRVVLETTDYTVTVSMPVWSMTAQENADQLAVSQHHFQQFLQAITGDDPRRTRRTTRTTRRTAVTRPASTPNCAKAPSPAWIRTTCHRSRTPMSTRTALNSSMASRSTNSNGSRNCATPTAAPRRIRKPLKIPGSSGTGKNDRGRARLGGRAR
jgi:hypothetical protein